MLLHTDKTLKKKYFQHCQQLIAKNDNFIKVI